MLVLLCIERPETELEYGRPTGAAAPSHRHCQRGTESSGIDRDSNLVT